MCFTTDGIPRRVVVAGATVALLLCSALGHTETDARPSLRSAPDPVPSRGPSLVPAPAQHSRRLAPAAGLAATLAEASEYFRLAERAGGKDALREEYYSKAEELAEQALEKDADLAQAHFLLFAVRGRRLLADGVQISEVWQFPSLKRHLRRTLELEPDHAHALAAKGGLLLDLPPLMGGDAEAALEYLERAIALNPMGLRTRLTLAKALLHSGERDHAKQEVLKAAHYACRLRRRDVIVEAEKMLDELGRTPGIAEASDNMMPAPWAPRAAAAATAPLTPR